MEEDELPATGQAFYHAWIDEIVKLTPSINARLLLTEGRYSKAPAHGEENAFAASLSPDQRQMLASMLDYQRSAAMHDLLACLEWWLECGDVSVTYRGLGFERHVSLHGDYVGRQSGEWPWPTGS